jgi:hypothetical protein
MSTKNGTATLEDSLDIAYKTKHIYSLYMDMKIYIHLHKNLHTNTYSCFMNNTQNILEEINVL